MTALRLLSRHRPTTASIPSAFPSIVRHQSRKPQDGSQDDEITKKAERIARELFGPHEPTNASAKADSEAGHSGKITSGVADSLSDFVSRSRADGRREARNNSRVGERDSPRTKGVLGFSDSPARRQELKREAKELAMCAPTDRIEDLEQASRTGRALFTQSTDERSAAPRLQELLRTTPWRLYRDLQGLERGFQFEDFDKAFAFMDSVAALAKKERHHPEWSNWYNRVYVRWTTHMPEGLSEQDIDMALRCGELAEQHGAVPPTDAGYSRAWVEGRALDLVEPLLPARTFYPRMVEAEKMTFKHTWQEMQRLAAQLSREKLFYPVWSNCYKLACVTQSRYRIVESAPCQDLEGSLPAPSVELQPDFAQSSLDPGEARTVMERRRQKADPALVSGEKLYDLLSAVSYDWLRHTPAAASTDEVRLLKSRVRHLRQLYITEQ